MQPCFAILLEQRRQLSIAFFHARCLTWCLCLLQLWPAGDTWCLRGKLTSQSCLS